MNKENDTSNNELSGLQASNSSGRRKLSLRMLLIALVVLVVAVIAISVLVGRNGAGSSLVGRPVSAPAFDEATSASPTGVAPRPGDVIVTLSAEQMDSAHIKTEVATVRDATGAQGSGGLRTTGTVQPNAYKEIPVFPIAGGIVRQVSAQAGDKISRGQALAVIFSTELADAQGAYLGMLAEEDRHHQHYRRTVELAELGAASREDLEEATAQYKTEQAKLASMRERLILLGQTEKQIDGLRASGRVNSMLTIESPASGTILSRTVNAGEVVTAGKELFRLADLSTVWVVGQVYESDFALVRLGTSARVTTAAYAGKTLTGRVSFIDPRVDPQTRTAQVRVEVVNQAETLRLGMFVDLSFGVPEAKESAASAVVVPKSAIQMAGSKQVVFLATGQRGEFIQREVVAGAESNGATPIYSGLSAGDRVVTEGSFLLRAETSKLNSSQPEPHAMHEGITGTPREASLDKKGSLEIQSITITLSESGYDPPSITLRSGILAHLTFIRKAEVTCGTEILIPEYGVKRELPLGQPIMVELTPRKAGEYSFTCGMNMLRGSIIVR